MTQRIDRKTFEVDVDYSLLNDQTNAEIDGIKSGLNNPANDEIKSGWWTNRWVPYAAIAAGLLFLAALIYGFWHLHNKMDMAASGSAEQANSNKQQLTEHVTTEHIKTRSLLQSIAAMVVELETKELEADEKGSIQPTGPDWEKKYQELKTRHQNVEAELNVANEKATKMEGLLKSTEPTIKRSVVVFNSRDLNGREVVTGWRFDSVNATKPSSQYCYLSVSSGQRDIRVNFDIMRNKQKVDFPNSDMRRYGVSQSQLDRARSVCIWHSGKGA